MMHRILYLLFWHLCFLGCLNTQPSERPLPNPPAARVEETTPVSVKTLLPWIGLGTVGVVGAIVVGTYVSHPELFSLDWLLGNQQKDILLQDFKPYQEEGLYFDNIRGIIKQQRVGPYIVPLVHLFQQLPTLSHGNCAMASQIVSRNLESAPRIHRYNSEFKSDVEELKAAINKEFPSCAQEIGALLDAQQKQETEQNKQTACAAPLLNAFVLDIQKKLLEKGIHIQDQTAFYCDPKHPLFGEGKEDILWIQHDGKVFPVQFNDSEWRGVDGAPRTGVQMIDDRTGEQCIQGHVDKTEAYIGFVETNSRRCGLPLEEKGKGGKLIALFSRIAKALEAQKVTLEDGSGFLCKAKGVYYNVSLKLYSLIKHGKTLYERYGFSAVYRGDVPKEMQLRPGDVELVQQAKIQPILRELLNRHNNNQIRSLLNAAQDEHQTMKDFVVGMIEHANESIGYDCSTFHPLRFYLKDYPAAAANGLSESTKSFIEAFKRLSNHATDMEMKL